MTKIVYGVSGEGSGHSSRAREMLNHLQAQGHECVVVSYDRGYANLKDDFEVFETEGLHIHSVENQVSVTRTFVDNIARLSDGLSKLRELRHEVFKTFLPDVVITDFEPMTAYLANHYELPLITIDNQHRMRYMNYPCPEDLKQNALVTETVIRLMVPRPDVSLVTTFYFGDVTNDRTYLFPPILRTEITSVAPTDEDHIVVYLTQSFDAVLELLPMFPRERFVVYGHGENSEQGNVSFREFDAQGFVADLASCKAVIATAGFTLMTEALHYGKPYLALPMGGQFEQELNGLLLADCGYGKNVHDPQAATIGDFLYRLPDYRERLASYPRSDNSAITAKLDQL
ncbi:MAG: hypothetical protein OES38_16260, partial [Gammaproteobacteria bacterium]|nr:hypothetical protein [Gammaproteobacteria bacterium]